MNDPDPVVHEALRWLRFSEEDLDVALRLLSGIPTAPRHACWLSQQAAEKALKAALVLEEVDSPSLTTWMPCATSFQIAGQFGLRTLTWPN